MKAFRDTLSLWNELGLVVTGLLMIGYFGSRGMLGRLPMFVGICAIVACVVLSFLLANAGAVQEDDFMGDRPRFDKIDKFMGFLLLFLGGMALFTWLGTIV